MLILGVLCIGPSSEYSIKGQCSLIRSIFLFPSYPESFFHLKHIPSTNNILDTKREKFNF